MNVERRAMKNPAEISVCCQCFIARRLSFLFLCLLFFSAVASAQRKPMPRLMPRDYFVGKFVLIPRDVRPSSLQLPRLMAQVADHDLVLPPSRLLGEMSADAGQTDKLIEWVKNVDYADVEGVMVSLNALIGDATGEAMRQRLDTLKAIRARRGRLPIYGFVALTPVSPPSELAQAAIALAREGVLDFLLLGLENSADAKMAQVGRARLIGEIAAPQLADCVALDEAPNDAVSLLVARMLNRRFGVTPKLWPVYSSGIGSQKLVYHDMQTLHQAVLAKLKAADCFEFPSNVESPRVDIPLFVHTSNTNPQQRLAFVESLAQTLERGARVALADLSDTTESKTTLLAELRSRKLLDKLVSYASSDPVNDTPHGAMNRVIAHTISFMASLRFLRDDYGRAYRIDRAHVRLLFDSYLRDWAYALEVRPKLAEFLREQPDVTAAEAFITDRLHPLAEQLFNEQFRRNIHAVLLNNGERARFEVTFLQRLQVRLLSRTSLDAEINQGTHLAQLYSLAPPQTGLRADWELVTDNLDSRLLQRVEAVDWPSFKTDVEIVEINIKIASSPQATAATESYKISSTRKRSTRRIEITASSQEGALYAISKLEQLGADGQLARDVQLSETPALGLRGIIENFADAAWSHQERLEMLRFLGRVRMNAYVYAPGDDPLRHTRWREAYEGRELERLKELLRAAERHYVQFLYVLSPTASFSAGSEEDFATLLYKLDELAALGVRHFVLSFEDAPKDISAAAQTQLCTRVFEHLKQLSGKPQLSVWPAANAVQELAASLPSDIGLCLSGSQKINDRRAIVFDLAVTNEPWHVALGAYRNNLNAAAGLIVKPSSFVWSSLLRLATAAELAWESRDYDPTRALNRALNLLHDEKSRNGLRAWAQESLDETFKPLFQSAESEIALAVIEPRLAELQTALETIGLTPERALLRGELAATLARLRKAAANIKQNPAYEKLPNGNYRLKK